MKKEINLLLWGGIVILILLAIFLLWPPSEGAAPTEPSAPATEPIMTGPALTEHVHVWEQAVTKPSCAAGGYTTFTCQCGEQYIDEETAPLGHMWAEADCTHPKTCTACGIWGGRENGHSWDEGKVQKDPTENEDGQLLLTCTVCGDTKLQAIPSLNHVHHYQDKTVVEPTCTENGYTTYTCSCGHYRTENVVVAKGHTWEPASCLMAKHCTVCGMTEGTALGHSWKAATCTSAKICTVCAATEGRATGHAWKNATCDAPKTCATCGSTEGRAAGHNWDAGKVTKEPQEGKDGQLLVTCTSCGLTKTQAIPALNHVHNYQDKTVVEPTCTEAGYTTHTCGCGYSYADSHVAAKGHDWKAATCLEPKICRVCGATEGSAAGHSWKAATCDTPKTCTACGQTEGAALGHTWSGDGCTVSRSCTVCGGFEGIVYGHQPLIVPEVKPTCTEEGCTEGENCAVCGQHLSGQEVIPPLGHLEETIPGEAAGCTETGLTEGLVCGRCNIVLQEQVQTPAAGHSYGEWVVTEAPTCVDTGVETKTCSVCGESQTQTVKATGVHSYDKCVCVHCGHTLGTKTLSYRLHSSGTYYICTGTNSVSTQQEMVIPSYYNGLPVKEIADDSTFAEAYSLTVMEGIERIGDHAFYALFRLKTVRLPNSLTYIGQSAFKYCDNLESVYLNTSGWKAFNSYTGKEEQIDFSTPLKVAEMLRTKGTAYFTR